MTTPSDRPPTIARELGMRAHAIEHAVEAKIEQGLHAVEDSVARRYGASAVRMLHRAVQALGWLAVATYFAFGLTLLALRYWLLPGIDGMRPRIEQIASTLVRSPVTIGRIDASWQGVNPVLALQDVRIANRNGGTPLSLPRIEGALSWTSLPALQPRFWRLRIFSPELEIILLADGTISVAGFTIDPQASGGDGQALDWLLAQRQIMVLDARVVLRDERGSAARQIEFSDADLLIKSAFGGYRLGLQLDPPPALSAPIDIRGDLRPPTFGRRSDFAHWSGEMFAQLDYVDLAELNQWVRAPIDLQRAAGAMRAWLRVDDSQLLGATVDLALTDVDAKLAPDLERLRLASLQGRVTQQRWGDSARGGQEIGLVSTTFTMANGARFPPLDLNYRSTRATDARPSHVEITGSRIDLPSLAGIATHLPLVRSVREAIERYAPRGRLADFGLAWDGDEPEWRSMTGKARFEDLSIAAQNVPGEEQRVVGTPGFERLSGSIQLERGSGSLKLASRDAALTFPGIFREPRIRFSQVNLEANWKQTAQLEARIESLLLSNVDLEITASGLWRAASSGSGPGEADLSGKIVRLDARNAYRYIPLDAGAAALDWLQFALLEGRLTDGSFRLRGDLRKFPYPVPADGEFRAGGRLRGGVLDVAPAVNADGQRVPGSRWPLIRDIDAEVVFERQGMNVRAQRGTIGGANIVEATARIPDLGHDATLEVRGQVGGELARMFDYVNASPLVETLGPVTRGAVTRGAARVDLKLDIPLNRASDTRVAGALQLQNNDLTIVDVPPFTRIAGTVNFTERGVRFNNVVTGFLGATARLDAITRADGATVINASGSATVAGLRRALPISTLQHLLDRMTGNTRYTATLTIHSGTLALQADSDLIGIAIDGVAPVRKTAAEALPLRLEKTERPGSDDLLVTAGKLLGVRLDRVRERDALKLARGVVAINEPANPPESGMLVIASMPRLDVEAWAAWLGLELGGSVGVHAAADSDDPQIDYIAIKTADLVISNRSFRNVTLGASRTAGGGFDANVVSDAATGYIGWRPGPAGSTGAARLGQITARLSKLVIPAAKTGEVADALRAPARQYPAIELIVENFDLGNAKLGRLDLAAVNSGTGTAAAWKLGKLEVVNPDMKLTATGDWSPSAGGARRMQVKFVFDTSDAGATLTRFGIGEALARGHGRLEGTLEWAGSPFEIDYPSLSGTLALGVDDGRFMKVDTRGAGRLLTVLSLQSLSRTLVGDVRESFGNGFAFSSIKADAAINRGVLSTQNFRMTGASAGALMSGTLDLRKETQQLRLVVLPQLDASTAALALGVANPVIGLGALLANMVLKAPLSKAFALEYDITGSWSDPVVTRVGRVTPNSSENPR